MYLHVSSTPTRYFQLSERLNWLIRLDMNPYSPRSTIPNASVLTTTECFETSKTRHDGRGTMGSCGCLRGDMGAAFVLKNAAGSSWSQSRWVKGWLSWCEKDYSALGAGEAVEEGK